MWALRITLWGSAQDDNGLDEVIQAFSVKVWMPHSSLLPPQRPLRGSAPAAGMAVHGWQPMEV